MESKRVNAKMRAWIQVSLVNVSNVLCCAQKSSSLWFTVTLDFLFETGLATDRHGPISKRYILCLDQFSSVHFSRSVLSDSLQPHELQHAKPPCPSPSPGVHSDSRPLSQWCHPAISSSVAPFSSCPQSLPASKFFQWVNSSHEVAKVLEFQL